MAVPIRRDRDLRRAHAEGVGREENRKLKKLLAETMLDASCIF
jgi:hypothetical protein